MLILSIPTIEITAKNHLHHRRWLSTYYTLSTKNNKKSKLTINNLTNNTIEKTTLTKIISDIITNNESDIIKTNNISYQYTNKGEW